MDPALFLTDDKQVALLGTCIDGMMDGNASTEALLIDGVAESLGISVAFAGELVRWYLRQLVREGSIEVLRGGAEPVYKQVPEAPAFLRYRVVPFSGFSKTIRNVHADAGHAVREIFFATDRKSTGARGGSTFFGWERGEEALAFGTCEVSIPRDHRMGRLESPSILRLEFRADPQRHVVLRQTSLCDEARFRNGLSIAGFSALVFIHGFNVSFIDAVRQAAQLSYDLSFDGPVIVYSWPSRGDLLQYVSDEQAVEWSQPHFSRMLEVLRSGGITALHIVAHSMGNRLLSLAVADCTAIGNLASAIYTAPDVDRDVLERRINGRCRIGRSILYASKNDRALMLSKKIHGGYPRGGDVEPHPVLCDGVDVVDASALDTDYIGHGYFADNTSVISDMYYALRGMRPEERVRLRRVTLEHGHYWKFSA